MCTRPKVELIHCTVTAERKDNIGGRKKKGEEVGNEEWEAEDLHRPNKTKRGERDYTDCTSQQSQALMAALDTEFK